MKNKVTVDYNDGTGEHTIPTRLPGIQKAIAASTSSPELKQVKVVTLPCYGIRIEDDNGKVTVTSSLPATNPHSFVEGCDECNLPWLLYQSVVHTIEDMIASHYRAGVKVTSKKYVAGIEDAVYKLRYKS